VAHAPILDSGLRQSFPAEAGERLKILVEWNLHRKFRAGEKRKMLMHVKKRKEAGDGTNRWRYDEHWQEVPGDLTPG